MSWLWELIIDFIFPKFCVVCGKEDIFLCNKCKNDFELSEQICPMCGGESIMGWTHEKCKTKRGMDGLISIYDYRGEGIKKVIHAIKFDFCKDIIQPLMTDMSFELGEKFDMIVPLPLYFYRKNWRGFNQAEEIALALSKTTKMPVIDVLKRNRMTKQQSLLKTTEEREKNVGGAFEVKAEFKNELKGKSVLLVDDVFTSGADMRECTRVLKNCGVRVVWGFTLGH